MGRYTPYHPAPPYWGLAEAAAAIKVDPIKFRRFCRYGELPCCFETQEGYRLFYPKGLLNWAEDNPEAIEKLK